MTQSLLTVIEDDLKAAWGSVVHTVEKDAVAFWNDMKVVFTAMLPEQYAILTAFVQRAIKDAVTGDIGDIETALLNLVEVQELAWVKELGSKTLQAVIAVMVANQPTSTTTTTTSN